MKLEQPTEKEWKEVCKEVGCSIQEFHQVLGEYANLPAYMRVYCELWAVKALKQKHKKELKEKDDIILSYESDFQKLKDTHSDDIDSFIKEQDKLKKELSDYKKKVIEIINETKNCWQVKDVKLALEELKEKLKESK